MKREYIAPTLEAYKVDNNNIMAGSPEPTADPSQETPNMEAKGINFFLLGDEDMLE